MRDREVVAVTKKTTLSKSRFKLAVGCPTKVYYRLDPQYVNAKDDDESSRPSRTAGIRWGSA